MGVDEEKWPPRQVQWYINKQKDEARRPTEINASKDYFDEQMARIYSEYEEVCKRESLIDFGELLLQDL